MAGFHEIIGHDDVVNHLQNAIQMGKVSHAYIFNGEVGAGKKMLASAFAMALQCEKHGTDPCMECDSCKSCLLYTSHVENMVIDKHAKLIHSNQIIAEPEKPGYIRRGDKL